MVITVAINLTTDPLRSLPPKDNILDQDSIESSPYCLMVATMNVNCLTLLADLAYRIMQFLNFGGNLELKR